MVNPYVTVARNARSYIGHARARVRPSVRLQIATWRLGRAVTALLQDALVNLFTMYLYVGRCLNADADLVSFYAQNRNGDGIADDKLFSNSSCQNKHNNLPLVSDTSCIRVVAFLFTLMP